MRIAIFTDTFSPEINGVARTLDRLAKYLEKAHIEYQIFAPDAGSSVPFEPQVTRLTSIPFLLYPECRIAFPNPLQLKQNIEQFNPTLIHIATPFNVGLFGLNYGKKLNIPMVASYHTHFDQYLQYYHLQIFEKWLWSYMRWFHQSMERVFVPSQSTKETLIKHRIHQDVEIWSRGVDYTFYSPFKRKNDVRTRYQIQEKYLLLYVGRIAPEKDIHIVLETFQALPEQIKRETHLLLVGDGPLLKEIREHNHPQITFTGFLEGEELAEIYASADLFLFPSPTETFGNVVLEALASGVPVIGADSGGVKHLIQHKKNGFLCTPQDTHAFVQAVVHVLTDLDLHRTMSREARKYALGLSWEHIFQRLISSYQDVLGGKRRYAY